MFEVGDYVFAKIRGFPPWPAVIQEKCEGKSIKYKVYYYGTHEIGFVNEKDILLYKDNANNLRKISKKSTFVLAVKELEANLVKSALSDSDTICQLEPTEPTKHTYPKLKQCRVVLERMTVPEYFNNLLQHVRHGISSEREYESSDSEGSPLSKSRMQEISRENKANRSKKYRPRVKLIYDEVKRLKTLAEFNIEDPDKKCSDQTQPLKYTHHTRIHVPEQESFSTSALMRKRKVPKERERSTISCTSVVNFPLKIPILKLRRLDETMIIASRKNVGILKSSSFNGDGSKKRKTSCPKKLKLSERSSEYSLNSVVKEREGVTVVIQENVETEQEGDASSLSSSSSGGLDKVGEQSLEKSASKNYYKLLRKKMFSVVRKQTTSINESNKLIINLNDSETSTVALMKHERRPSNADEPVSDDSNPSLCVVGQRISLNNNGLKVADTVSTGKVKASDSLGNLGEKIMEPELAENSESDLDKGYNDNKERNRRYSKPSNRCDVCWKLVENVTDHILTAHMDMFT